LRSAAMGLLRTAGPAALLGGLGLAVVLAARGARLERADFTFSNGTEITTLDPATVTGVPEGRILRAIFEGLTVKDPLTLEPLPGSAERWELSEDGRTYTFHLRHGARWTNGDPVTAHDFVYSWERMLNPNTGAEYAYQLWYVEGARAYTTELGDDGEPVADFDTVGIRAIDDHTLEVVLEHPTPFFLQLTAFYPLFPVNRRSIEEAQRRWPDSWRFEWLKTENLVTNGPFRVAERRVNDRIRLVKYEDYWDADSVAFRSIDALAVEQYMTNLNLYLQGDADWINYIPNQLVTRLMPREDLDPTPYFGTYFYRVNTTEPPLDDARVRRALALTIDRLAITRNITKSGQIPWYAIVPYGTAGYAGPSFAHRADAAGDYEQGFAADVAEARALLAEAGYGPGGRSFPTIEIHYNTSETHRDIAEVVADSWKRHLGVPTKLLNQEWKVYLDTQTNLGYDVSRSAWIGDYLDPNTFMDLWVTGGENNKTGWGDERYDDLIARAKREVDPERRFELFYEAEALLLSELPILPVYSYATQNMVNPRVGAFPGNLLDEQFAKWWYWRSDEELAADRAARTDAFETVEARGPAEGLYPPNAPHGRFAEGDPRRRLSPLGR
ncbi:MAG TPA: peptide ABC transporter substrate-binding protein, partial [Planctomycetota bacterium]|nr:peptide ABC transporter substrate-binding protein [Planctomycetota bacterium]